MTTKRRRDKAGSASSAAADLLRGADDANPADDLAAARKLAAQLGQAAILIDELLEEGGMPDGLAGQAVRLTLATAVASAVAALRVLDKVRTEEHERGGE